MSSNVRISKKGLRKVERNLGKGNMDSISAQLVARKVKFCQAFQLLWWWFQ